VTAATAGAPNKTAPNTALGALLTMFAMLCFAGMDATSKFLVADYAVGQMMWIRCVILYLFAWFIVRRTGVRAALKTPRPGLQITRALLLVIESALFVFCFKYLPLADAHALASTSPLIVIALGVIFLGERAGVARWLAVVAGFAGVLLIIRPGFRDFDWPLLVVLVGAGMWASYQILTRLAARHDSADTSLIWSALVALIATTFVAPIDWVWPTAGAWALIVGVAMIGSVANYALIKALDYAEAGALQPYSYTLLVWATLMGFVVFGDFPDFWTIVGAAVIVASSAYTWHHDRQLAATRP
jgi:drug/metabolite transporter (DMT)-like permease